MKMELGAQTFTVRDYMQTTWDFREAMKRIAEIGYTCVQLSAMCRFRRSGTSAMNSG